MKKKLSAVLFKSMGVAALVAATGLVAPASVDATPFFADVVIQYFDGPYAGNPEPFGGTFPGAFPVGVPLCVVLGSEPGCLAGPGAVDFLSLPLGSFVDVGFTDDSIADGPGADFTVFETVTVAGETARVFGSTDFGATFTFIGVASGTQSFDIAGLGFASPLTAIRVFGTGLGGASPGYDLEHILIRHDGGVIPEPGTVTLLGLGMAGLAAYRRRKSRR